MNFLNNYAYQWFFIFFILPKSMVSDKIVIANLFSNEISYNKYFTYLIIENNNIALSWTANFNFKVILWITLVKKSSFDSVILYYCLIWWEFFFNSKSFKNNYIAKAYTSFYLKV